MLKSFAAAALMAGLTLSACATVPPVAAPAAAGTPVPLNQPVYVGDVVVTPLAVKEDSRCPANAQCVWAGRVVVTTQIDGPDDAWRDTRDLELEKSQAPGGKTVRLAEVSPAKTAGAEIAPADYRFRFDAERTWHTRLE